MGQQKPQKVGSASDVQNVNPYTEQTYNTLQNWIGQFGTGMGFTTPEANLASLTGAAPAIQGLVGQLTGPYVQSAEEARDLVMQEAMKGVASQYAQGGAVNSGAALSAMARGAALPAAQTAQQIAGLQGQIGYGLGQQYLGQLGSQYQTQAGLLGQGLGMQTQMGMPEWWQPTYLMPQQGMGAFGGGLTGASIGGSVGGPWGAAIGGTLGAFGGLLGL
jgi:hypothetical protein